MDSTVCIANIGPDQRALRQRLGIFSLAAAVIVALVVSALGLTPWGHVVTAFLVFGGFAGIFQAREHT